MVSAVLLLAPSLSAAQTSSVSSALQPSLSHAWWLSDVLGITCASAAALGTKRDKYENLGIRVLLTDFYLCFLNTLVYTLRILLGPKNILFPSSEMKKKMSRSGAWHQGHWGQR